MHTAPTPKFSGRNFLRLTILLTACCLSLTLMGCLNLETTITIYDDESWEGAMSLDIPASTVELVGGMAEMEKLLDEAKQEAKADGVDTDVWTWGPNGDGGVTVEADTQGMGLETLEKDLFGRQADVSMNSRGQITIRSSELPELGFGTTVIKISGGRIIDSNADEVQGGTAIWRNPEEIDVTLMGAASLSTWLLWGAVGGGFLGLCCCGFMFLLLTGAGGFYWYQRQNQKSRIRLRGVRYG